MPQSSLRPPKRRKGRKLVLWLCLFLLFGGLLLTLRVAAPSITAVLPQPFRVTAEGVSAVATCVSLALALWTLLGERRQQREAASRDAVASSSARLLSQTLRLYRDDTGCPLVRELEDRSLIGVSRALETPEGGRLDEAYAPRDVDSRLDATLRTSRFMLVVGDSKAGKSRSAFEAVRRNFPDRHLVVPQDAEALRTMLSHDLDLSNSVVWLDNFDEYLRAPAIDEATINRLRVLTDVTVVATMRSVVHTSFSPRAGVEPPEWRLLKSAETVRLQRLLTDDERRDAEAVFLDDGVHKALTRLGLAEYLSGAPDLLDYFEDGRDADLPVWALVSAAIDLIRCGLDPAPHEAIVDLARTYLPASTVVDDTVWALARSRTEQPIYGTSSLIRRVGDRYKPFDYLLDHADTLKRGISKSAWSVARQHAHGYELVNVGMAAMLRKEFKIAQATFQNAVDRETPGPATAAMYHLGLLSLRTGNKTEARRWLGRAHARGFAPATTLLGDLERTRNPGKALELYERAAGQAFLPAAHHAGVLLLQQGNYARAATHLEPAAEAGDVDSANRLAKALFELERFEDAARWFRVVADARIPRARQNLALCLMKLERNDAAREELATAVDEGDVSAEGPLGLLSLVAGDTENGEKWLRRAAERDDCRAMAHLGIFLADRRRRQSAEAQELLRRACATLDAGDTLLPSAKVRLARLLADEGRFDDAVSLAEPVARAGHVPAVLLVGRLYAMGVVGDREQSAANAEKFFRIAVDGQSAEGPLCMALLMVQADRIADAEPWLEQAAGLGDHLSQVLLKVLRSHFIPTGIYGILRWRLTRRRRAFGRQPFIARVFGPMTENKLARLEAAWGWAEGRAESRSRRGQS